jgi:hypothetical protein
MAKSLRAALAAKNVTLSHSECLELVSKQLGFSEWNMLSAKIALETREPDRSNVTGVTRDPTRAGLFAGGGRLERSARRRAEKAGRSG